MRARDLAGASLMVLAAACASQDAERFATPAPLDAPAPVAPEREEAERANNDDELGLAEYERLLADKESRLRAAGVLLAVRDSATVAEARGEGAFAPPPPPAPVPAEEAVDEFQVNAAKAKRPRKDAGAGRAADAPTVAQGAAPAPAPVKSKGATTSSTSATREKKVEYKPDAKSATNTQGYTAADDEAPSNRCQSICDLSAATCELEGKICDLATRHPGDPRYGDLCRRADDDCRLAAEACQRCSP
ncbi:hypothetical protein OV203_15160 [Nannocystis sp. ILAH1]|uniref:hypothetical protein n=1 Tax=unclassified Nannocystis TaxID=2627009 RepID=UPI00226E95AB|nr:MULTISPECIES: hypothetical protein [unclassified Nannocystis]MCY0988469.1 hypothetical protein [Nannocystis sp. ILAH1]MCY1067569.1 hypothetical protein [Nannocystis sp. RBIL2]